MSLLKSVCRIERPSLASTLVHLPAEATMVVWAVVEATAEALHTEVEVEWVVAGASSSSAMFVPKRFLSASYYSFRVSSLTISF